MIDLKKELGGEMNKKGDHLILDCPWCGKPKHLYLNVDKAFKKSNGKRMTCFDCKKCGVVGDIEKFLNKIDRLELLVEQLKNVNAVEIVDVESGSIDNGTEVELKDMIERKLPVGFERIYSHPYLAGRGFEPVDFIDNIIGVTKIGFKYRDYIIFAIQEGFKIVGFVARSLLSKEELKKLNEDRSPKDQLLRWSNSENFDISQCLYGIDEVNFETNTIVLVEGIFDKKSVDRTMRLRNINDVKCLSKFGKNLNEKQIRKIKKKGKNINTVILIDDPDAVEVTKRSCLMLKYEFKNVLVGYTGEKDLGDSTAEEVRKVFSNLESPVLYNTNKVLKKELQ